jgi:hypothetical protein
MTRKYTIWSYLIGGLLTLFGLLISVMDYKPGFLFTASGLVILPYVSDLMIDSLSLTKYSRPVRLVSSIAFFCLGGMLMANSEGNSGLAADLEKQKEKDRLSKAESFFSPWNGSNSELEESIKATLNDPNSYDHVETRHWNMGAKIRVKSTFRAKNAYNATITSKVWADLDAKSGKIIKWGFDQ